MFYLVFVFSAALIIFIVLTVCLSVMYFVYVFIIAISCLEHRATRVLSSTIANTAAVLMFPLYSRPVVTNQMRPCTEAEG